MNVNGFLLIDAPSSALNNAGAVKDGLYENMTAVKKFTKYGLNYPYVSAQALRYWWRNTLSDKMNWNLSPITQDAKQVFTEANPIQYPDDDVFGYMRAQKKETLTRLSPLKVSPLIAVNGTRIVDEFGVMARQDGNPAPYNYEIYSVMMKGIFSLDLRSLGKFTSENRAGYKNISLENLQDEKFDNIEQMNAKEIRLTKSERIKRASDVIAALSYISGGAKQTLHHTDVTPKLIVLTIIDSGVQIFSHLVGENQKHQPILNLASLRQVMDDYKQDFLSPIFIGRRSGFQDNWDEELSSFASNFEGKIFYGSIRQAIDGFLPYIESYYGRE